MIIHKMYMMKTDEEWLLYLEDRILNDIHIIVSSEEAYGRFRQKQIKAIDKYCKIWCDSHGHKNAGDGWHSGHQKDPVPLPQSSGGGSHRQQFRRGAA